MKTAQRNKKFVDMYHNNKEFREKLQTKARERYHIIKGKTNFR
jgi:predicted nuclease with TOPRIM domain